MGQHLARPGVLHRHPSNNRLLLGEVGGRGMPRTLLREGDAFLVDMVEAEGVDMMRDRREVADPILSPLYLLDISQKSFTVNSGWRQRI